MPNDEAIAEPMFSDGRSLCKACSAMGLLRCRVLSDGRSLHVQRWNNRPTHAKRCWAIEQSLCHPQVQAHFPHSCFPQRSALHDPRKQPEPQRPLLLGCLPKASPNTQPVAISAPPQQPLWVKVAPRSRHLPNVASQLLAPNAFSEHFAGIDMACATPSERCRSSTMLATHGHDACSPSKLS